MTLNMDELMRGGTLCVTQAGLKISTGGSAEKVEIAASNGAGIDFAIDGIMYHLADADELAMTAADEQADLYTCLYLICLNSAGTLSTVKGIAVLTTDLTAGSHTLKWPTPAADTCPIGAVKIINSGAAFTAGTTALTGISTFYDLVAVPTSPLTS